MWVPTASTRWWEETKRLGKKARRPLKNLLESTGSDVRLSLLARY
jgi:hypothetical protein